MKHNKLKMNKLTEEEKKALAKQYRYEQIGNIALILLGVLVVVILALIAGGLA